MKIWWQVYTPVGIDPRTRPYEESLAKYIPTITRPGTAVDIHGVPFANQKMNRYRYLRYLHAAGVINSAVRAEREGYDAFILGGTLEIGILEIREAVSIPVIGLFESSCYLACQYAPKFGIVTYNQSTLARIEEHVKLYGLQQRALPCAYFARMTAAEFQRSFNENPGAIIEAFTTECRKLIEQGASVLIPGYLRLNMLLVDAGVRQVDGVPILDTVAAAVKMAEVMVDLSKMGMSIDKRLSIPKEELREIRKQYGVE